jgi:hypothetical protein
LEEVALQIFGVLRPCVAPVTATIRDSHEPT